ncbi:MAG TPA: sigma-54 dependent transcriptional regulator [Nitrospiraceae bacterium]|nr:sigma-54 dependent transcriptional regulator [Nitrospiraceae bacterium]
MAGTASVAMSLSRAARGAFTILLVEDNPTDTELLLRSIELADLKAVEADVELEVRSTAEGALQLLGERPIDLVLTDMVLPGMSGLDLVSQIQTIDRNLPVLVITHMAGIQTAVDAMRRGAYDYIVKPVNPTDLGMRLHRAIRISEILRRNSAFERIMRQDSQAGSLVGTSKAFQAIVRQIREAAHVRSTVLISGETGTGKGLIARAIHEQSRERDKPYQVIDCATIPEGMVESELFGHVRGAFTGAVADKPGLIELADGGTVFLDEIEDLPLPLQSKLLRVLEDNEVRRVGGTQVKRVDMRFLAATNQELEDKIRRGTFRKDLYYRLAVIVIRVPPLRERVEDIPVIARHLLAQFGREMGKSHCYFDASAISALTGYAWPGNVRELRNVVERAVMLATEEALTRSDVETLLPSGKKNSLEMGAAYASLPYMDAKAKALDEFTRAYLKAKLSMHDGHITRAAEDSGIPRQHFSLLMKRYLDRE